jgi:hypothetical protein
MSKFKYSFKGTEENGSGKFPIIPEGDYKGVITDWKETVTDKGDPIFTIQITIIAPDKYNGRLIRDNLVFPLPNSPSIKIKGRTMHFLHCIGEPYLEDDIEINPDNWIQKPVFIYIKPREYNGKTYANVYRYNLPEDINPNVTEETFTQEDAKKVNMTLLDEDLFF